MGWWVDYLIKLIKKKHLIFPELWPFENLGFLKFVSKISKKLFELGAWNLISR